MREECERLLLEAGWVRDGDEFRHPDGQRARYVDKDGRMPRHLHLSLADRPVAFALELRTFTVEKAVALAGCCERAIATGAALPWAIRAKNLWSLWVTGADGVRHRAPASVTSAKKLAAGDPVAVIVDSLTRPPEPEALERAEAALSGFDAQGWTDTTRGSAKPKHGQRLLRRTRFRGPAGEHHLSYVLTGDPVVPEALRWNGKLAEGSSWDFLIGATASGPALPGPDRRSSLSEVSAVLRRSTGCRTRSQIANTAHALAALTVIRDDGDWTIRVGFDTDAFARSSAPKLPRALAELHTEPGSGEAWLTAGFAALDAERHDLAVSAFTEAAERGTGGGLPWLWRGWLRRHLDPEGAAADLDRAATVAAGHTDGAAGTLGTGSIVGEARLRQAMVLGEILGDTDRELTAREQGTGQDPDHVGGWESRGLALAKHGRAAEAVEVLTRALERHSTARLRYYLGYANLLTGEPAAALDQLERAVRLDNTLADPILADPDLAALKDEPRFAALPRLASLALEDQAEARRRAHLDHRRSLRPEPPRTDPAAELAMLRAAYKTYDIYGSRYDAENIPRGITNPTLRELLSDYAFGVAYQAGDFTRASGSAPEPYEEDQARPLPLGLGAGMYHLGDLGDGDDEVAVDGETGEVFLVELDGPLSYLAPSVAAFLIGRCVPAGEHAWNLSPEDLDRLDRVDGIGDGRLRIFGHRIDTAVAERLTKFITEHGALLHTLLLTGTEAPSAGLAAIDFAATCPNLRRLHLHNGEFDDSVLRHPRLEQLNLRQATYNGGIREFRLTSDTPLRTLYFEDCVFDADTLYAGPGSALESFGNTIDEDYGGTFPQHLEFDGAARLRGIQINCGGAYWKLVLRGELPALTEVRQDARPYGRFDYAVEAAEPADRKRYFSMIRKGKDYTKRR